jgi:hypothetical protein
LIAGCRVGLDECRQGCLYCPDEDCEILRFSGFSRCDACSFGLLFGGKGSAAATAGSDRKGSARKVRSRTLGELHPPQLALRRALLSGMLVIFFRRATPVARERAPTATGLPCDDPQGAARVPATRSDGAARLSSPKSSPDGVPADEKKVKLGIYRLKPGGGGPPPLASPLHS